MGMNDVRSPFGYQLPQPQDNLEGAQRALWEDPYFDVGCSQPFRQLAFVHQDGRDVQFTNPLKGSQQGERLRFRARPQITG